MPSRGNEGIGLVTILHNSPSSSSLLSPSHFFFPSPPFSVSSSLLFPFFNSSFYSSSLFMYLSFLRFFSSFLPCCSSFSLLLSSLPSLLFSFFCCPFLSFPFPLLLRLFPTLLSTLISSLSLPFSSCPLRLRLFLFYFSHSFPLFFSFSSHFLSLSYATFLSLFLYFSPFHFLSVSIFTHSHFLTLFSFYLFSLFLFPYRPLYFLSSTLHFPSSPHSLPCSFILPPPLLSPLPGSLRGGGGVGDLWLVGVLPDSLDISPRPPHEESFFPSCLF